jgi:hypothetical protein
MKLKFSFLLISCCLFSNLFYGQDKSKPYIFTTSFIMDTEMFLNACDPVTGNILESNKYYFASKGLKFDIVGSASGSDSKKHFYKIKFWHFTKNFGKQNPPARSIKIQGTTSYDTIGVVTNGYYFALNDSDFDQKVSAYYFKTEPGFQSVFGIATMPVKLRFGDKTSNNQLFDFSKDISLAATGGLRKRIGHRHDDYVNLLLSIGISSITADSLNTNGFLLTSTDASAFTWGLGAVFQFSAFQFGFFGGWDYAGKELSRRWVYNKDFWFSAGIGVALFTQQQKESSSNDESKKNQ